MANLEIDVSTAKDKLKRLYKMVEDGVTDLDEILKDRLSNVKLDRDRARTALDRIRAQAAEPSSFNPEAIENFGRAMRENMTSGDVLHDAGQGRPPSILAGTVLVTDLGSAARSSAASSARTRP